MQYILCACLVTMSAGVVHAALEKTIHFSSEPEGCHVILKQGLKEIDLGTTPLDAGLKFRSQLSVLRLAFRRPGFREALIEITPDRSEVHVNLDAESFFVDVQFYRSPELVKVQEALMDSVTQHLQSDLSKSRRFTDKDKIYLAQGGDTIGIVFNLQLSNASKDLSPKSPEIGTGKIWKELSKTFADTINYVLSNHDIDSVLLNVSTNSSRLETKTSVTRVTKMKWVGGYVYSPATGTNVYNPFHHQVPVVIEGIKPAGLEKVEDRSLVIYEVMSDWVRGDIVDFPYESLRVRQYDQTGQLVLSRN